MEDFDDLYANYILENDNYILEYANDSIISDVETLNELMDYRYMMSEFIGHIKSLETMDI